MSTLRNIFLLIITLLLFPIHVRGEDHSGMISGKVLSVDGDIVDYATVYLKGTKYSSTTNDKGMYHINAPAGEYTLVISSVGFEKAETKVKIKSKERVRLNVKLKPAAQLAEVIVVGNQLTPPRL